MIITKEPLPSQKVFDAVRTTIQGIHSSTVFEEDASGAPFLFKSKDGKVWVRVFYHSLNDSTSEELARELLKLKILMAEDASVCLFYPLIDQQQLLKFQSMGERIVFFEYGGLLEGQPTQEAIQVRKWVPAVASLPEPDVAKSFPNMKKLPTLFISYSKLSSEEVAELTDLGLSLKKI